MVQKSRSTLPKLIVILGPTGSGKSSLAHKIAKKINGEIVLADSRQVYKYFSIGTNKDRGMWKKRDGKKRYIVDDIPHYMIDCVDPRTAYTLFHYKRDAELAIDDIISRGKTAIISGGTGMYLRAITENWQLTEAEASGSMRHALYKKSHIELLNKIRTIDSNKIADVDIYNKRRLVRLLEVFYRTGTLLKRKPPVSEKKYNTLKIGIHVERSILYESVNTRVDNMMEAGLLNEIRTLSKRVGRDSPVFSSIGYRELLNHLEGNISLEDAVEQMKSSTRRYVRKQLTWWRREKDVHWINSVGQAEKIISSFLK